MPYLISHIFMRGASITTVGVPAPVLRKLEDGCVRLIRLPGDLCLVMANCICCGNATSDVNSSSSGYCECISFLWTRLTSSPESHAYTAVLTSDLDRQEEGGAELGTASSSRARPTPTSAASARVPAPPAPVSVALPARANIKSVPSAPPDVHYV